MNLLTRGLGKQQSLITRGLGKLLIIVKAITKRATGFLTKAQDLIQTNRIYVTRKWRHIHLLARLINKEPTVSLEKVTVKTTLKKVEVDGTI